MVENAAKFTDLLQQSQDIAIVFEGTADVDTITAASSLFVALLESGKAVRLFSPELPKSQANLVGIDQVLTSFGHQNLLVSFAYSEDKVDKISYHIGEETSRFYLTIKPKKGIEPLDAKLVEFSYSGAEPDLIITVGVSDLENLGSIYMGYEQTYANSSVVSLHEYETSFGTLQLTSMGLSSLSELVVELLKQSQVAISASVATNLLFGLEDKTRGLRYGTVTAETFGVVAELMRAGGERTWVPVREATSPVMKTEVRKITKTKDVEVEKPKKIRKPEEMTVSVSRK
ncbi:hypothetical protein KBC89_01845 [Candidatus Woesebacteria bacterium]|nr:hypothetical protein [Candidatus Woesebacteria bacterium]